MNKSEIFKAAHKLAKTFVGSYVACFALALKQIYKGVKKMTAVLCRFVKFNDKMCIELNGEYYLYSVVDTSQATHDWQPSGHIETKTTQSMGEKGVDMFNQLHINQGKPTINFKGA